ncbi:MAG: polysaccharide deacetylase family protein [Chthoniobacterales bacterium]
MNLIQHNLFPGGKSKAVTLSYDDGVIHDRRFVEILNRYGIKSTFHLNSGTLDKEGYVTSAEVQKLYQGHEISAHSVTHPHLETLPPEQLSWQILEDRRALESLAGYPVRGMSYPYGTYNQKIISALPAFGMEYARTTESHEDFYLPKDFLKWMPTCHHSQDIQKKAEYFIKANTKNRLLLFYIWGHTYEFDRENNWELIEQFCAQVAAHSESLWFATNIEIVDYLRAMTQLRTDVAGNSVRNFSSQSVWISINGKARELASGEFLRIA